MAHNLPERIPHNDSDQSRSLTHLLPGMLPMATRVLIVEPDEDVLFAITEYFRRTTDFDCESTTSGQQCIDKLEAFGPDVLIMEPSLPCESSGRVLDAIASASDRVYLPVLVLTRLNRDPNQELHTSISEYLVKPQSLAKVVEAIRRLTSSIRKQRTSARDINF
jgi:DNA-binding response OmpR family regulator